MTSHSPPPPPPSSPPFPSFLEPNPFQMEESDVEVLQDTLSDEMLAYMLQERYQLDEIKQMKRKRDKELERLKMEDEIKNDELIAALLQSESEASSLPPHSSTHELEAQDEALALQLSRQEEEEAYRKRWKFGGLRGMSVRRNNFYPQWNGVRERSSADISSQDVDHMSYEELLELSERIGTVQRGVSLENMSSLPTFQFTEGMNIESTECSVCQEEYIEGEVLRTLPCFHNYHLDCIDRWLKDSTKCPICGKEVM